MLLLSQSVVGRILNFSRAAKAEPCGRSDGARCSCSLGLGGQMAEEVAVAVCVRVKPLSSRELEESTHVYWKTDNNAIYQIDGSKSFSFDRVFHSDETTKNVYDEIAVPIIDSAIQGYNGTIFAYGQTASGKTHTMMGSGDCLGVIPRAIHDIFQKVKKFPEREFLLRVSYMEIYNETITDLLCNTQKMKPLIIREDINRNVYVADLTEEVVYTSEMALQWLSKGEKNRHYGITKMNQGSSHSHTIFRMILESRENGESSNVDGSIKVSHLNLVDLAGSERAAQTGAEGVRLKEGCNINQSLFILGQVIKKLSDEQTGGFINYQDSKLTRILQNSLGGNAKTCIICTITPVSFDETLTTLQFASTAKYMKNTPFVNEVSSDGALLKRYRKEIMDLKKQLEDVSIKTRAQEMEKDQLAQLLEEKGLLQKIQDEKIQNLQQMLVTSSSIDLQQELKAKNKRRVTWCLGKINKMKDSTNGNEFEISTNITTRSRKASVTVLRERDESVCFESDTFGNTLEPLTEIEWSSATKLLSQENLEGELNSLHAKYDDLVLDNEQLRRQNEDLELQLKEKQELDEFEALERKLVKEQEIPVLHEEHMLLPNVREVSECPETVNELEPVEEQSKPMDSTTLRNLAMERLKLMEKLQGKEEERKHLNKPKDNWKMLKGFQLEYNLLKEGITENFAEIPVLHEEHVLLPNVREVSECPETVNELEPVEEQSKPMDSTTLRNLAMERLKLMEKLQGKEEERKHPNKPKDNWKMLKGFQLEYNLLKKGITENFAEIPVLHEEHVLLPNVREVSECPETVNELEPVREQSKPMDSTTLRNLAMERLKLMEKLQGKEEERKHPNKPKDNWKMLKGFQLEYNLLKKGIIENFAEIPVLHEEHVLLPNVREVSECPETVNELEPVEEQSKPMDSTTLENLAMERLKLMEKLQGKEEERKHPNKPKDNWKMLKGFQLEYNLLKKALQKILLK